MKNKNQKQGRVLATEQKPAMHWPSPFEEMEQWFENGLPSRWMPRMRRDWPSWEDFPTVFEGKKPSVDVINRENEILIRAEMPGVDKKDIDISATDTSVTIKGSVEHEEEEEKEDYYRREVSSGSYARTGAI